MPDVIQFNRFESQFAVGKRTLGGDAPAFIIAEAGVAHFGDFELAKQLVQLAKDGGADAFKIQVFDVDALISKRSAEWRDRLRPRVLAYEQVRELKAMCDRWGLEFMMTAHDESKIPWLQELDVAAVKVGSGERNNVGYLKKLAGLGRPVLLSTGMYSLEDVKEALAALAAGGCSRAGLLHCVTSYPTPPPDINLRAMDRLKEIFPGPVGYSDHTEDDLAVMSAVARGAKIIERHITILRNVPNAQDWKVSSGPDDFPQFVARIRRVEAMLGHGRKEPAPCEEKAMAWALKSLVAGRDLPAGHTLTGADLATKRPGDGILPNQIDKVLGRKLRQGVAQDDLITWENLA